MNIFSNLEVNRSTQGNVGIHFYVIAKKAPRFKRITIEIDHTSTTDSAQNQLKKYIESHRLIRTVMVGQNQCEISIGPKSPYINQLRAQAHLHLEERQVVKINVMTAREYKDFSQAALVFVKQAVQEQQKQKTVQKTESQNSVNAKSQPLAKQSLKKDAKIFNYYVLVSRTSQAIYQFTMNMLLKMREMRERIAERDKEHSEEKVEERRLFIEEDIENRIENNIRLANEIKVEEIQIR
jgi:hypothetical protein